VAESIIRLHSWLILTCCDSASIFGLPGELVVKSRIRVSPKSTQQQILHFLAPPEVQGSARRCKFQTVPKNLCYPRGERQGMASNSDVARVSEPAVSRASSRQSGSFATNRQCQQQKRPHAVTTISHNDKMRLKCNRTTPQIAILLRNSRNQRGLVAFSDHQKLPTQNPDWLQTT
jgi:hypothetical protein